MGSHCRHCAYGVSINFRQDRAGARRDQGGPRRRVAHQAVAVPMPGHKVIDDGNPADNAVRRQREDVKSTVINATVGYEIDATGKY